MKGDKVKSDTSRRRTKLSPRADSTVIESVRDREEKMKGDKVKSDTFRRWTKLSPVEGPTVKKYVLIAGPRREGISKVRGDIRTSSERLSRSKKSGATAGTTSLTGKKPGKSFMYGSRTIPRDGTKLPSRKFVQVAGCPAECTEPQQVGTAKPKPVTVKCTHK